MPMDELRSVGLGDIPFRMEGLRFGLRFFAVRISGSSSTSGRDVDAATVFSQLSTALALCETRLFDCLREIMREMPCN